MPQISLILGPCAGGAVYSPAITDFMIMAEGSSYMFVTGPNVVKAVTHEEIDFEGLGGARVHNEMSGVAHFLSRRRAAGDCARRSPHRVPAAEQRGRRTPRAADWQDPAIDGAALDALIPDSPQRSYDMHAVIQGIVDGATFLEVHAHFARNIICGFARIEGRSVGIVAQQPEVLAGRPRHRRLG